MKRHASRRPMLDLSRFSLTDRLLFAGAGVCLLLALAGLWYLLFFYTPPAPAGPTEGEPLLAMGEKSPASFPLESLEEIRAEHRSLYLLVGQSKAGAKADILFLTCLDSRAHTLSVMQFPPSLYLQAGGQATTAGEFFGCDSTVMTDRVQAIEGILGTEIDGWFLWTASAFSAQVDRLGGITLYLPADLVSGGKTAFQKGWQTLNGTSALSLLCYRGFSGGVTGTADAQNVVLSVLLSEAQERFLPLWIPTLASQIFSEISCSLTQDGLTAVLQEIALLTPEHINYMTCPGDTAEGASVYTANRAGLLSLTRRFFCLYSAGIADYALDMAQQLNNPQDEKQTEIYWRASFVAPVYTGAQIAQDALQIQ